MGLINFERNIIYFLRRKAKWGGDPFPMEALVNWSARKTGGNEKRVKKAIELLKWKRFVIIHNSGISLNADRKREILEFLNLK